MLNTEQINKWLTLLANFGVVAGIVFLAVEIRQNQTLLEQNHRTMLRDQELEILNATHLEVEQFNDLRAQIYLSKEVSELWLDGRSGEFDSAVEEYRYNQLCSAWFIANGLSYERSIILDRPAVAKWMTKALKNEKNTRKVSSQDSRVLKTISEHGTYGTGYLQGAFMPSAMQYGIL